MQTFEININEVLSQEEIKDIAKEEVSKAVARSFEKENDIRRIIANSSYDVVYKMVDSVLDEKLEDILKNKVLNIIEGLSDFNVFKKPDAWDREPNEAYKHLQKCIQEQFPRIKEVVSQNIESSVINHLKVDIEEKIYESISLLFKEAKNENI